MVGAKPGVKMLVHQLAMTGMDDNGLEVMGDDQKLLVEFARVGT